MATLVFLHAHPDDEALLTAGTMAKAAAHGHRVVLVMATDGQNGLAHSGIQDLVATRTAELHASSAALGVHRVVTLDYPSSPIEGGSGFSLEPVEAIADRVADVLVDERADILVGYDPSGGYGHCDHRHIHHVARTAARMHPDVRLFEVTLPREPIRRATHLAARLGLTPHDFNPHEFDDSWSPRANITHRVNVRAHLEQKRAALRAHASQATADSGVRTLQVLTALPKPVAHLLLGTEYYVRVQSDTIESTIAGSS